MGGRLSAVASKRLSVNPKQDLEARIRLVAKALRRLPTEEDLGKLDYWKELKRQAEEEFGSLQNLADRLSDIFEFDDHEFPARHQWEAVTALAEAKRKLIAYDTGTGKTAVGILAKEYIEEKSSGELQFKEAASVYLRFGDRRGFLRFLKEEYEAYYELLAGRIDDFDRKAGALSRRDLEAELYSESWENKKIQRELLPHRRKLRTLVVVPNTIKGQWKERIKEYLPDYEDKDIVIIDSHGKQEQLQDAEEAEFVIINYELLYRNAFKLDQVFEEATETNGARVRKTRKELLSDIRRIVRNAPRFRAIKKRIEAESLTKSQIARVCSNLERLRREETILARLAKIGFDYVIADEVHNAKNPLSRCSNALVDIAKRAEYLALLTATPIPNSLKDLGVAAHMLDPGRYKSIRDFNYDHQNIPKLLHNFFRQYAIRTTIDDIEDLKGLVPRLRPIEEPISLDDNEVQRELYCPIAAADLDVMDKLVLMRKALLDPYLLSDEFAERYGEKYRKKTKEGREVWRLRKLAKRIIPTELRARLNTAESEKYNRLDQIIAKHCGKGEKVVVFSSHFTTGVTDRLADRYKEYGAMKIDGSIRNNDAKNGNFTSRRKAVLEFETNPDRQVLIANLETLGEGVELVSANNVVFLDLPYTPAERWQGLSRLRRIGNEANLVRCYNLITQGMSGIDSLDQAILKVLRQKERAHDIVMREKWDELDEETEKAIKKRIEIYKERPIADILNPKLYQKIKPKKKGKREKEQVDKTPEQRWIHHVEFLLDHHRSDSLKKDYIRKYVEEIARDYYEDVWYRYAADLSRLEARIIDALVEKKLVRKRPRMADLGSNGGFTAFVIGRKTWNLEQHAELLEEGRRYLRKTEIPKYKGILPGEEFRKRKKAFEGSRNLVGLIQENDFEDDYFDVSLCNLVLQWNNRPDKLDKIFRQLNRVTKKDGYVFIGLHHSRMNSEKEKMFYSVLGDYGFEIVKTDNNRQISGFYRNKNRKDKKFSTFMVVAKKVKAPKKRVNRRNLEFLSRRVIGKGGKAVDNPKRRQPYFRKVISTDFVKYNPDNYREIVDLNRLTRYIKTKHPDYLEFYDSHRNRPRPEITSEIKDMVGLRIPRQLDPAGKELCIRILYALKNGMYRPVREKLRCLNVTRWAARRNLAAERRKSRRLPKSRLMRKRLSYRDGKLGMIDGDVAYSRHILDAVDQTISRYLEN